MTVIADGLPSPHLQRKIHEVQLFLAQNLRIARAAHLLRESDLTVTQILHRVGFHSPSHFTTTFRRHMGMSPTDYRRRADFEQNANRFSRATDPLVHQPEHRLSR